MRPLPDPSAVVQKPRFCTRQSEHTTTLSSISPLRQRTPLQGDQTHRVSAENGKGNKNGRRTAHALEVRNQAVGRGDCIACDNSEIHKGMFRMR